MREPEREVTANEMEEKLLELQKTMKICSPPKSFIPKLEKTLRNFTKTVSENLLDFPEKDRLHLFFLIDDIAHELKKLRDGYENR